jgi:hypothetical protein
VNERAFDVCVHVASDSGRVVVRVGGRPADMTEGNVWSRMVQVEGCVDAAVGDGRRGLRFLLDGMLVR